MPCAQYKLHLGLVVMCTIWTWTWANCHVYKMYITQILIWVELEFMKISQWQINALEFVVQLTRTPRKEMQYLTFKLHFSWCLVLTTLVNTFEIMDDLTYLTMNIFKTTNNECDNLLLPTSPTFTNYSYWTFKNNLNVGVALGQNYCLKKKGILKERGKGKEEVFESFLLDPAFYKNINSSFFLVL